MNWVAATLQILIKHCLLDVSGIVTHIPHVAEALNITIKKRLFHFARRSVVSEREVEQRRCVGFLNPET